MHDKKGIYSTCIRDSQTQQLNQSPEAIKGRDTDRNFFKTERGIALKTLKTFKKCS